jgi:GTPase
VADASNPAVFEQIAAAYRVLDEIGIREKDTLLVLNKIDAIPERGRIDSLLGRYPTATPISARTGRGVDELTAAVSAALSRGFVDIDVEMDVADGRTMAYLASRGEVFSTQFRDSRATVHCRLPQKHLGSLRGEDVTVRPHGNGEVSDEP